MPFSNIEDGRIFISYRRSDAKGYAGRLADSLEKYFGNKRVFRDIEDIKGGAAFGEVIEENLKSADAVVVLIGPTWLSVTGEDDTKRLHSPGDWVAQEIATAIELGVPLFPVLIEQTPMPRQDELPEKLWPLLSYNAIALSDNNWSVDVLRLGKVLSLDIPSANERRINFAKTWSAAALFTTLAFSTLVLLNNFFAFHDFHMTFNAWKKEKVIAAVVDSLVSQGVAVLKIDSVQASSMVDSVYPLDSLGIILTRTEIYTILSDTYNRLDSTPVVDLSRERTQLTIDSLENLLVYTQEGPNSLVPKDISNLLKSWQAGIPFIGIGISLLLIFTILPLIDQERQRYLKASIYGGAIAIFIIILLFVFLETDALEAVWSYIGSILITVGILALMSMSGFKPK